jgi:hypothetical protein
MQIHLTSVLRAVLVPASEGGAWWTAINPVPTKSRVVASLSKAMGMRAGTPDLLFIWRGAILIELKAGRTPVSEAQEAALSAIYGAGAVVHVCRSAGEVLGVLATYRVPMRGRVLAGGVVQGELVG